MPCALSCLYFVWVTPQQRKISTIVEQLLRWYSANARDLPWRRTQDPYGIWVAEVMLQQTQVKTVLPYWERWMAALPDIKTLARCAPQKLHKLWEGLGYYTRVRNMQKAARLVLEKHGGEFPRAFDDILALPGIGRYTAGAISSIAFQQPKPLLDGNVVRVLTRLFAIDGDPRGPAVNRHLWELATELVLRADELAHGNGRQIGDTGASSSGPVSQAPAPAAARPGAPAPVSALNQSLMELGALVCTSRAARCGDCPTSTICAAHRQGRVESLPARGPRPKPTQLRFAAFIAQQGGRFLVRQRPPGVVNAHLWEFPNLELDGKHQEITHGARLVLGVRRPRLQPLCVVKHSITRYRITLEAYRIDVGTGNGKSTTGRWMRISELRRLPFTSAHKKILDRLQRDQLSPTHGDSLLSVVPSK